MDLREQTVACVHRVQALPYTWPARPDAASARTSGTGTCASKHALLAEELLAIGIGSAPLLVVGPLVPEALANEADCAPGRPLREVHECLTVLTPWAGPLLVDVTWDPALAAHGLESTRPWDGASDMRLAVAAQGPGWSVDRSQLRAAKEALRARLYAPGQRDLRDRTLRAMSEQFARWRMQSSPAGEGRQV